MVLLTAAFVKKTVDCGEAVLLVKRFFFFFSFFRFVHLLLFKNMCCEIGPVAVIVFGFFLIAQGIFALFTVYIPDFGNGFVLWEAWLICVLSVLTGVVGIVSGAIACGQVGLQCVGFVLFELQF